jgi:hypothetical protein
MLEGAVERSDREVDQETTRDRYEYLLGSDEVLHRRDVKTGHVDRLVDGGWIPRLISRRGTPSVCGPEEGMLHSHVDTYLLGSLTEKTLTWRLAPRARLARCWVRRIIRPPLGGGAMADFSEESYERTRRTYEEMLDGTTAEDLEELREAALRGCQRQVDRISLIEQRANFFLGTAGLTTTLVLANAGLLVGAGKLHAPWLGLSIAALAVASACAIAAGFCAIQAAMLTFARIGQDSPGALFDHVGKRGTNLLKAYLATLLINQEREWVIGEWKMHRVATARRLFLGVIGGVVLLTAFVLLEAV